MTVWFVSSSNPGLDAFLEQGCVAVNFWVRSPVAGRTADDIRPMVTGPAGPELAPRVRTRFANQLAAFTEIEIGDHVISFSSRDRQTVHVGVVSGPLSYEDPPRISDHPHVLPVCWTGTVAREALADGGAAIPSTPGTTVARVYDELGVAPAAPAPGPARVLRPPSTAGDRVTGDGFTWDPPVGEHRYRLVQTFGRIGSPERPFVVILVNPGGNDLDRVRRSTTCHRVRSWGLQRGFDGASYLNLFSVITNDVRQLAQVHPDELNGPEADDAIRDVLATTDGQVIAGWGNPSVRRSVFDARVEEIHRLAGARLRCLGLTQLGHPKHARTWMPEDEPVPLR